MATTTKLTAANGYYGHSGSGAYATSDVNHLYVGKSSGTSNYRSRMTFPAMGSLAAVGESRIRISKILLYIRRNDGGPTEITVGCSASSKWGAAADASANAEIGDETGWYCVDLSAMAEAVNGYDSKWYLHITGETPRLRFSSTGSKYKPYLMVTWESVAATIAGDRDSAVLGADAVTFTISPEVEGETHQLTYALGDSEGSIAQGAGNSVVWTPPLALAAEIPNDDTAAVEVRMTAYDSAGKVQRTELYYQTVTVPESLSPVIADVGVQLVNGLSGYGLAGQSALDIAPVIDMSGAYGATIDSLTATLTDGQEIVWSSMTESEPGVFTGAAARTGTLQEGAVDALITVTDSRGRSVSAKRSCTVCAYSPPVITGFSVERYEPVYDENEEITGYAASDLGDHVWVNLTAQAAKVAPELIHLNTMSLEIQSRCGDQEINYVDTGSSLEIALVNNRDIFPNAIGEDETWTYTVIVTDSAGGTAVQYATVAPAHASFSLSPDKWGAAVGMIATGRKSAPKFEVAPEYESHFYGGAYDRDGMELVGGALVAEKQGASTAVANNTETYIVLYTAEKDGVYLANFSCKWDGSASGMRRLRLCRQKISGSYDVRALTSMYAGGSGNVHQEITALMSLVKGQSVVLSAWQNSGSAMNIQFSYYQVARIGA